MLEKCKLEPPSLAGWFPPRPWMNVLLVFAPLAFIGYGADWSNGVIFAFALLAIAPFAERLGFVTEQLAFHTNETRTYPVSTPACYHSVSCMVDRVRCGWNAPPPSHTRHTPVEMRGRE